MDAMTSEEYARLYDYLNREFDRIDRSFDRLHRTFDRLERQSDRRLRHLDEAGIRSTAVDTLGLAGRTCSLCEHLERRLNLMDRRCTRLDGCINDQSGRVTRLEGRLDSTLADHESRLQALE
jgi:hypothetical protein